MPVTTTDSQTTKISKSTPPTESEPGDQRLGPLTDEKL